MANIKDVARHANVSVTTVSHVINKTRFVSADLEQRVWEAVRVTNYQPNALARSLRIKQTRTIGMVIPDNANPFFAEVAHQIEDQSFDLGYNVILCNTEGSLKKEQSYVNVLLEKQVDGVVLVATSYKSEHLRQIVGGGLPVVVVDRELEDLHCDVVIADNLSVGQRATRYLLEIGHQVIACITGPSDITPSSERVRGYHQALEAAGLQYQAELLEPGNFQADGGYSAMRKLLAKNPRPTGVFACNDIMAIGALRAIGEAGLKVPQDIAIVGVDNIPLAEYTTPPLTTVALPYKEMGRLATELLISRINGDKSTPQRHVLGTKLVVRASS